MSEQMRMPVNLMETLDEDSSHAYIQHVLRSALAHARAAGDLSAADAQALWAEAGLPPGRWTRL